MTSHKRALPLTAIGGAATALAVTVACVALSSGASAGVAAGPFSITVAGVPASNDALNGAVEGDTFTATVAAAPGQISSVKWILDGVYLGKDTTAPFQVALPRQPAGIHTLRARVYASDQTESRVEARFTGTSTTPPTLPPTTTPPTTTPPTTTPPTTTPPTTTPPTTTPPTTTPPTTTPPTTTPPTTTPPTTTPTTTPPTTTPAAPGTVVHVSDGTSLAAALAAAGPGTTIALADGAYASKTQFTVSTACTATAPCTLTGSRSAVLDGAGYSGHYGLHLLNANYWTLSGFSVTDASKGIVADHSSHNTITGVQVSFIGDEGIHLRDFSSDNLIKGSLIHDTGQKAPQYGEGVYVGSAHSNWAAYSGGLPDNSDRNQVIGNTIYKTGAENVDIKEGTTGGLLASNSFNGAGMSGLNFADSWVDVKGNSWTITGNTGANSINDGFQSHVVLAGWGQDNTFSGNTAMVGSPGYGFNLQSALSSHDVVFCNNIVSGAGAGFSNIPCTP